MTEIVKLNPTEFGLTESKASEIAAQFKPMLDKMVELEAEYNAIIENTDHSIELSAKAKELRLKYVKVRTGTAEIHKKQKDFYLSGGRFVDGWKNAQIFASKGIEETLENIEKYFERAEAERIERLGARRNSELQVLGMGNSDANMLGTMSDEIWGNYIEGVKISLQRRLDAERQAEIERLAAIEKEKEEKAKALAETRRLLAENARIAEEQRVERDKQAEALRLANEKAQKERLLVEAQRKAEQDKADALLEQQRKDMEKQRQLAQQKLKAEKDKSDKLAAELKAKALEEANRIANEQTEARRLAAAPDKEKLLTWLHDIKGVESVKLSAENAKECADKIQGAFESFYQESIKLINNL